MSTSTGLRRDLGLLLLRVGVALPLIYGHGWGKLANFSERAASFDPIGLGTPQSLLLVMFAEVFCALAVALGILTRWAAIPPIVAMSVAAFIRHGGDPFDVKEKALLYLVGFLAILLLGSGKYSLGPWLGKRLRKSE